MTDPSGNPSYCERCGRELGAGEPGPVCAQCALHDAEASIDRKAAAVAKRTTTPDERDAQRKRMRRNVGIVIVVSLAIIAFQAPAMVTALQPAQPRRDGTVATDAKADTCISNLWTVLSVVTEGQSYGGQPTCPVSGAPYVVSKDGNVVTVACPNPEKHRLSTLSIRSDTRLPVVR